MIKALGSLFFRTLGRGKVAVLAVVAALTVVGASTAFGATGVNFILGKGNTANAMTSLVTTISDTTKSTRAALLLDQRSGGPALDLRVTSGKAPMKVNSATKVANLNSDLLDGLSSTAFLRSTAKAADSEKLDGMDSTVFLQATGKAADSEKLDGNDSSAFLGSSQKAIDSEKLDGLDSDAFASASHDHDNRYSPKLFAAIRGKDATPIRSSNLLATFKYFNMAGSYEIVFDRDVSSCVYSATLINETAGRGSEAPNGQIGVRPLYTSARGVAVTTYDASGARADRDFSIVVHC